MIILIYTAVIFAATTLGAISGLGGGVVIKPLFDMVGFHTMSEIGFYSSVAVFTMSIVSIFKQMKNGFGFHIKVIFWISFGSLIGGLVGESIFNKFANLYENGTVKTVQAGMLGLTLVCILIYTFNKSKIKSYRMKNIFSIFIAGFFLGTVSVFLGIGGGPLNVALLMFLFSYTMKEATVYSIATIFFAQISKLGSVIFSNKIHSYNLFFIPFICISAVAGGFIGTMINQKLDSGKIEKFYIALITALLFVSLYNVFTG
ncbi:sulfite exporter TauE/SafE family protein [Leptotrichia sp. OH3620_COT-345]|uniref:sulfite exporter TauE/SafE family protein n=1 Tax=Leptotrichia sp. OH3620_COT-345 TaxID=2491048 RepID=UPI000F655081|nr:sulfite exporter TauE/SafE family protein [Leptotrichia sp. OH3620_COT-345]RRD40226.1 sulfite exporter TauE/SafE family protein [Leptotrichia sp. OH3620_COT-345]